MFHLRCENVAKAVEYLEKACDAKKDATELHFLLAKGYRTLGDIQKSEEYFRRAISKEPDNFEYLYNYGSMLHGSQRLDEAIEVFEKAAMLQPENYELLNDIGVLCHLQQKYNKAMAFLKTAINKKPDYVLPSINLGYVYLATGNLFKVKDVVDKLRLSHRQNSEVVELKRQLDTAVNDTPEDMLNVQTELSFSDQSFQIAPFKITREFGEKKNLERMGLSIVIPIRDEKENIPILYDELTAVLNDLKERYEIIFVDDGSTDGSSEVLGELARRRKNAKVVRFRRNYGQTAAISAGFRYAQGGVIITIDGDLQNDPADIPRLLEKMAEGYDLVSGWRKKRQDNLFTRKIPSMVANSVINYFIYGTGVKLQDFGCTLTAYKRGIIKNINLYGEMHRFIPVFAAWLGVRVGEIPVNHRPRRYGYVPS